MASRRGVNSAGNSHQNYGGGGAGTRGRGDLEALEPLLSVENASSPGGGAPFVSSTSSASSLPLSQSPPGAAHAHPAPFSPLPPMPPTQMPAPPMAQSASAPGKAQQARLPKRTTKTSQKLTLFPEGIPDEVVDVETLDATVDDRDITTQLPHVTAKTQKERWLTKIERKWLPRVTAYCTANAYKMNELLEHLRKKSPRHHTQPKRFDEVIYTPFAFPLLETGSKRNPGAVVHFGPDIDGPATAPIFPASSGYAPNSASSSSIVSAGAVLGVGSGNGAGNPSTLVSPASNTNTGNTATSNLIQHAFSDVDSFFEQNIDARGKSIPRDIHNESLAKQIAPMGEIFYFDYGVVVMWGLTELEEHAILDDLEQFEDERLAPDSVETEQFYFHYHTLYQPRIYNDIITLRNPANYMLKITISHAIAQSVKLALFEGLIEETIDSTKHVPQVMAIEGKINMSRKAINQKIGQLFIMRINVNLVSNVLDTPEIFWSEPALEPLYRAVRGYLEISQRVELLNQRVSVISDLLDMLKEHLNSSHGEQLEWIVIILIGFEIFIGIITITVDLTAYYHRA